MNAVKAIRRLCSLDRRMLLLLIEAYLYLAWARFLVIIPFSTIAPSLGVRMEETALTPIRQGSIVLKQISAALHLASRHTPWDSKCLVRAIAAMKMLERRRIESTLYLGTAKDAGGGMIAHAWLRSGTFYLTGSAEMGKFTVVGKFAKRVTESSPFSQELKLLLAIMKQEQDELSHNQQEELSRNAEWGQFIQLVRHHRVSAVVYTYLKQANHPWVPSHVMEALQQEYNRNIFRMLHLSGELACIGQLFAEHQIRVLSLKGPALAFDLYGDISLRTSKDLDILVSIDELDQVNKLLLEQGYMAEDGVITALNGWRWRQHHIAYYHPHKRIYIELHWRLNPGPSKEPSFNELWERRKRNGVTSYPMYSLGEADLFCYLISHGARHGWFRLRWLADMDILMRRQKEEDWTALNLFLKREYQLTAIGGQALSLASMLLDTPLSKDSITKANRTRSKRLAQFALSFIKEAVDLHSNPPAKIARNLKRYLFTMKSKRQKLMFFLNIFYPYPIDAQTLSLPKYIYFLYLPLRPILWAWRKARHVLT